MTKRTQILAGVALALGAVAYFVLGKNAAPTLSAASGLQDIHDQVATDAVAQYEIVKRTGTPAERCAYAGMVVAAYVQSKDEPAVVKWKTVQHLDCGDAGVPMQ